MGDKTPMTFSPFVGPDSLREATHLMKALYDSHTKRYCGYEDINGSQYVGTVENFGAEMLLETRKILMDKPPLKNIFIENTFDFYFDINFAGFVDTYDQQNMLSAKLKKNVLLSNNTYRIKFENVIQKFIPRSKSSSDPNVIRDKFLYTTIPPKLIITNGDNIKEVELKLSDSSTIKTDYYFHIDYETADIFDGSNINESINLDYEIGTIITEPITDNMYGRPMIWMCINEFRSLPMVNFINNDTDPKTLPFRGVPILTIGTNGHNEALIYPAMRYNAGVNIRYMIKVYPIEGDSFIEDENASINYSTIVGEIHVLGYLVDEENFEPSYKPLDDVRIIKYDTTFSKIYLNKFTSGRFENVPYYTGKYCGKWFFGKPKPGDYDYDGTTYHNRCYAFTSIESFLMNSGRINDDNIKLVPGFKIHFDDKYINNYEISCDNAVVGIHIDVTSDHSDNGVSKKNGVIYDMGDFDGLPSYFKYMIDDTIHRAHIEAYAIRNKPNDSNQISVDKQTAGVIIDSGIPQNEIQNVTDNLPVSIKFDRENLIERIYEYDESISNPSKTNYLSEISFVDEYNFGNANNPGSELCQKFVYHGNRHFSLGMTGFDPELEMGRVYIISNDKASYDNNETTDMTKSPLTFARICDIPTDFSQLVHIEDVAPTLIIDPEYVRMFASFTTDDKNSLYNLTYIDKLIRGDDNSIIFNYDSDADFEKLLKEQYPEYHNLNESINLSDTENIVFEINSGGNDYNTNDIFSFYIGGLCVKGMVSEVDEGIVTKIVYEDASDDNTIYTDIPFTNTTYTNRSNFKNRLNVFETTTVSGIGKGLKIKVSISQSLWDSTKMNTNGVLDDVFYFEKSKYGDIWSYSYSGNEFIKDSQITGVTLYENAYDKNDTNVEERTIKNCFIYNMINPISNSFNSIQTMNRTEFECSIRKDSMDEEHLLNDDLSYIINKNNCNIQNGLFMFNTGFEGISDYYNIIRYELGYVDSDQNNFIHPAYSDLSYSNYVNKTNKFRFNKTESQPSLFIFDPTVDTIETYSQLCKDIVKIDSSRPMILSDFLTDDDINKNKIISKDGKLTRNVYTSNEFDLSHRDNLINKFNDLTQENLIDYLKKSYPDALPLKFENTDYEYSKRMILNYIIQNILKNGYNAEYTDGSESIYRRPEIRLFRQSGEQIFDDLKKPIGDQPKGLFKNITSEKVDSTCFVDKAEYVKDILFVFKIDDDIKLDGNIRIYDDLDNDISKCSMLILNNKKYITSMDDGKFTWCEITKSEE